MQRRRFLQLTASAATLAAVPSAFAAFTPASCHLALNFVPHLAAGETRITFEPHSNSVHAAAAGGNPIELLLEHFAGIDRWLINGALIEPLPLSLECGQTYRLRILNATPKPHLVCLHQGSFNLKMLDQSPLSGQIRTAILVGRYNAVEAEIIAGKLS